jgi:transcriptional regulator with XRE-family HTH domain
MIQRLVELMRIKNLTSSQLADSIGVQRSGISHFISGRNKPSLEFILKILNHFPDINPDWLLFGKEPILRNGQIPVKTMEKEKIPESNFFPSTDETLPGTQPSFLEDLFSENVVKTEEKQKDPVNDVKNQQHKQKSSLEPETGRGKKTVQGDDKPQPDENKSENPERIVVFYKNRTFKEYLPE